MAKSSRQGTDRAGSGLPLVLRRLLAIALLASGGAHAAADLADTQRILTRAEEIKISDPQQFTQLIGDLTQRSGSLPRKQRELLEYLQAWKMTYAGDYRSALPLLKTST